MHPFRRRFYHRPGDLLADAASLMTRRRALPSMMRGDTLDPTFRERLMLAVTAVNGCRYCSYVHARQALQHGISPEEIRTLGDGLFLNCPDEQLPALLYAQHWAATDARPDPEVRARVLGAYGPETLEAIETTLATIRVGNLLGNTADYVLYRLSFGRWGESAAEKAQTANTFNTSSP